MIFRGLVSSNLLRHPRFSCFNNAGAFRPYQTGEGGVFGNIPNLLEIHRQKALQEVSINFGARIKNCQEYALLNAYRRYGHIYASVDPVPFGTNVPQAEKTEMDLNRFQLTRDAKVDFKSLSANYSGIQTVSDAIELLDRIYCGPVSVEFEHVENELEREWLYQNYENIVLGEFLDDEYKIKIAKEMLRSQNFDNFVATKFSNVKRYGGEGAESMMAIFIELIQSAGKNQIQEYVIGMAHRGRLNLMTGIFNYPPVVMFRKMKGLSDFPSDQRGASDVLSHLTSSVELKTADLTNVHVTMLPNPSHLEAVNPVAAGKVRARHMSELKGEYSKTSTNSIPSDDSVCVQVHGDAALSAQGINQEILQMSQVPHFGIGGSLHFVTNNQVGFTTPAARGRTSRYCTDIAKQVGTPVIHANGDCPEEVAKATRFCLSYQRKFRKDIFMDLCCYRRHGHNELDDPTFTNPMLYKVIHNTRTIPDAYAEKLVEQGIMSRSDVDRIISEHTAHCTQHFNQIETYKPVRSNLRGKWGTMQEPKEEITEWDSGVPEDVLKYVGGRSVQIPEKFALHSHLNKHLVAARVKKLEEGNKIDWGLAEALAVGSLLYQGFNVRFSGQDVGRATFAHRHAMLVDQDSNEVYIPLNNLGKKSKDTEQGFLEMANSILSEEAVLGFEYGMSVESPRNLIIWEAQFGDFFNGAQIILDTYVGCGESKWGLQSGLVILLPHGLDGAGPEHSSCRMERWLQMSDSCETRVDGDFVNWHIVNPTTAAQYFHLLRRQMVRNFRKPLIVVAPKTLLRLPAASSTLSQMKPGEAFQPVLDSSNGKDPKAVSKVIFVSGKHFYALEKFMEENKIQNVALVRLEQICPFPVKELQETADKYPNAQVHLWSQEEHRNMGAWNFVQNRFRNLVGIELTYKGRGELCQPATGIGQIHQNEVKMVIEEPFK